MFLVFYRTSDVFDAEERLNENNIKTEIAPTPVQDKAYCGVCVKIGIEALKSANEILLDLEYQQIE